MKQLRCMMRPTSQLLSLLLLLQCISHLPIQISATNILQKGQNLTDGETLVSAGGSFTLGFFSPGVSTKRYLGIWFSVSNDTVYWVANRDAPLGDGSGILVFNDAGSLVILDGSRRMAWSSDFPGSASAAVAQLLESGNLVVRNGSSNAKLWQSFDYPSDTLLPGMKMGKNSWSGAEWQLTSWRSAEDPSPGDYSRTLETNQSSGLPELVLWHRGVKTFRTGPWNGLNFNGVPEQWTYSHYYKLYVTTSATETTYGYDALPGAPLTRVVVNHTGVAERLVWEASSRVWTSFFKGPKGDCDAYATCGEFGLCNDTAVSVCGCVPGFIPASPTAWQLKRYAGGCRRDAVLDCRHGASTDRFKVVAGVKLPDTQNASVDTGLTLEECKARCYADCSCLAYAAAYIQEGGDGTGCIIWVDTIVDLRLIDRGQNLYLRLSKSEFESVSDPDDGKRFPILHVVAPIASAVTVLLAIILIWWRMRRRILDNEVQHLIRLGRYRDAIPQNPSKAVRSVNLATIKHVTRNFSDQIGQKGRFGVVYKAQLAEGRIIAVKRLERSALTRKGKKDFAREVEAMAGLRHMSLVRLLDYCNQGKERILVYEYMGGKSLDVYIFGTRSQRTSLDWARRLEIIQRVAHGVAYLHGGSGGISVSHGDLKPGNILLDDEWKAKISDFGIPKLVGVDKLRPGQTIVISPGYAAPEYEPERQMTLKCDVYSFGVTILETLSGRKNDGTPSLLSYVQLLCEQNNIMELLDTEMQVRHIEPNDDLLTELKWCIAVGLHCVQEDPDDRPDISEVVGMLTRTTSQNRLSSYPTVDSMVTSWSRDRENGLRSPVRLI